MITGHFIIFIFIGKKAEASEASKPKATESKTSDGPLLKQEDLVLKEPGSFEKTPKILTRPTDRVLADYRTTSSQYNAVVGGLSTTCKSSESYFSLLGVKGQSKSSSRKY